MNHITSYGPGDEITWGPVMDSRDPRNDDDGEFHTEQSALDQAAEDVLATPYAWSWFLSDVIEQEEPVDTAMGADWFAGDATVDELLAVVMDCGDWVAVREARAELRDRFMAHRDTKLAVQARADKLVGEPV